jgi:hypothetical protein
MRRTALTAVAVAGVLVAAFVPAASARPVAKGPAAARHTHNVPGQLTNLSCASPSACYAIGLTDHLQKWAVTKITHKGAASHAYRLKAGLTPNGLSCPSAAGCELMVEAAPSYDDAASSVSANGKIGKPINLGEGETLTSVACYPTRAHCTFAGFAGQVLHVVTLAGSTPVDHDLTLASSVAGATVRWLACESASCYAVGNASIKGKVRGFVIPITAGVPGNPTYVASASYYGIVSIACPSATTCYALGSARLHQFVYTVRSGKVTRSVKLPAKQYLYGIACRSASVCDAAGFKLARVGNPLGAVLPIHRGKPGKLETSKVAAGYSSGDSEGVGPISAFHGGIMILGVDVKHEYSTLVSAS